MLAVLMVGFAALFAMESGEPSFLDIATALALVSFLGTVALACYAVSQARREEAEHGTQPGVYIRMHASTKAGTLGSGLILLAVAVHFSEFGAGTRALAAIAFLLFTAPVSAHMIAKAAYRTGVPLWSRSVVDDLSAADRAGDEPEGERSPKASRIIDRS